MKLIYSIMRTALTISLLLFLLVNNVVAQDAAPGINFQALARDIYSNPAKDRKIYVQSSLIQATPTGTIVLTESFQTTTDPTGVFGIVIGQGTRIGGTVSGLTKVDWANGPYYLNLKIAITPVAPIDNWDYTKDLVDLGTTVFGAVPYALYASSVTGLDNKLNYADTTKMLTPYAKSQSIQAITSSLNTLTTSLAAKLNITDTAGIGAKINLKANNTDVVDLSTNVASNTASITANTNDVITNANNITSLGTTVASNTASITANATAIVTNANDITSLGTTVASNTASITSNATAIVTNANDITTLGTSVASNTASITANTTAIAALSTVATSGNYNDLINKPTLPAATTNSLGAVIVGNNLTIDQNGILAVSSSSLGVPYTGATSAVNLGAYDLTVNGLTVGIGAGANTYNTVVGYNALTANTSGSNNSAFGRGSLKYNTTGNYNAGSGPQTLNTNTTGSENAAFGALALFANQTGSYNTAAGTRSLYANTTGSENVGLGQLSLYLNQTGSTNTAIGTRSMFNNVYGNSNTAVGYNASTFTGQGGTSAGSGGNNNTSLGYRALYANNLGNENTAVGFNSLTVNTTGTQNTAIGSRADVASNNLSNATAIGYMANVATSNTIQLGNTNVTNVNTSGSITTPQIGVGTTSPVTAAAIEINSTTKGFLPPRMRAGQRDSIVSPVQGLVVYCTNCGSRGELEVYNGSSWVNLLGNNAQSVPGNSQYAYSFVVSQSGSTYIYSVYKFDGNAWTYVSASPISTSTGTYIGTINNLYYSYIYNGSSFSTYSFNGTTWNLVNTSGTPPSGFYGGYMGIFNNKAYHFAYNGSAYATFSFDGTTWQSVSTSGTAPSSGLYGGYLGSFNNISYFSAYNGSAYYIYSFDGTTWTNISSSPGSSYYFIGQIGNISYLGYYNGTTWVYSTYNGSSFANWTPTGIPSGTNAYNFNFMGVVNDKLYTVIIDNSTGAKTLYSFDGNTFTNLSSITNPGLYFGGFNCYMCNTLFIGGNLK